MSSFTVTITLIYIILVTAFAEVRSNSGCKDVSLECEYRQKYCYSAPYTGLMFKVCRSTCDWCQKSLDDLLYKNRRIFAAEPVHHPDRTNEIHEGSGNTETTDAPLNCEDVSKTCSATFSLCTAPSYQHIMSVKCPKTCGFC